MGTRTVRDIMIPADQYPSVRDRATLREAVAILATAQLTVAGRLSLPRALLVYDAIRVVVGYVRRRDLMRGLEPRFLLSAPLEFRGNVFDIDVDPNLSELSYDRVLHGLREQAERPVSDVMQPIEALLSADDHVMKAAQQMVLLDLTLIPVVEQGQLVGVVRSADVFHEFARLLL